MSDMKELAKHLLAEIEKPLAALVHGLIDKRLPPATAAIANVAVDVLADFAEKNPGIGGAAPSVDPAPVVVDGTPVPGEVTLTHVWDVVQALSAKLDALVQATNQGNAAAMGAHL